MPGYEPFLLCDFHVHTRWSDGRLSLRETIDLYGETGRFDVIAITDHILMERDVLARAARIATLGRRRFSVGADGSTTTSPISAKKRSARGGSTTCSWCRGRRSRRTTSAAGRTPTSSRSASASTSAPTRAPSTSSRRFGAKGRFRSRATRTIARRRRVEIGTCYLWDHREELADLVDVWEAANRDDLFSVTSLKHYPYVANSDFHKPKHLFSWKTLLRAEKTWPAVRAALAANVDVGLVLFRPQALEGAGERRVATLAPQPGTS
jgi:hypothetical protein